MHPTMKSKLANLVKHSDTAALAALLTDISEPHERTQVKWAIHFVERSRRHRERSYPADSVFSFNPGR